MNDTRTNILNVAEDLIQRVGLNAMSYKDISDAVGIRKASIHHHFPQKKHLIDALLERCSSSYGNTYVEIVGGSETAPVKLRKLAQVFEKGLNNQKLCLIGSVCTDTNTLEEHSCHILQATIENTVATFAEVFEQGERDGSLQFAGNMEDAAFSFFSFLVGAQTLGRSKGGVESFHRAAETFISSFEV